MSPLQIELMNVICLEMCGTSPVPVPLTGTTTGTRKRIYRDRECGRDQKNILPGPKKKALLRSMKTLQAIP